MQVMFAFPFRISCGLFGDAAAPERCRILVDGLQGRARYPTSAGNVRSAFSRTSAEQNITIHCTPSLDQMMKATFGRPKEFLEFWTPRPEIHQVWFQLIHATVEVISCPEMLQTARAMRVDRPNMLALLGGVSRSWTCRGYESCRFYNASPESPGVIVPLYHTQRPVSGEDLKTRIVPCQFRV